MCIYPNELGKRYDRKMKSYSRLVVIAALFIVCPSHHSVTNPAFTQSHTVVKPQLNCSYGSTSDITTILLRISKIRSHRISVKLIEKTRDYSFRKQIIYTKHHRSHIFLSSKSLSYIMFFLEDSSLRE